jgi:hypothetical protein
LAKRNGYADGEVQEPTDLHGSAEGLTERLASRIF